MDNTHDIEHVCKIWSLALPEYLQSWGDGFCAGAIKSIIKRRLLFPHSRAWERARQAPRSVGKQRGLASVALWSRICTLASKIT
jgi:hypothetical protein